MDFIQNYWEGLVAGLALLTAIVATFISFKTFKLQRVHNIKSIRPVIHIAQFDYENLIKILLVNNGVGPSLITKIWVEKNEYEKRKSIFDWLPKKLPGKMNYKEYLTKDSDMILKSGSTGIMLEIPINTKIQQEKEMRETIRGILRQLTVTVNYKCLTSAKSELITVKF